MSTSRNYHLTTDELQWLLTDVITRYSVHTARQVDDCAQIMVVAQALDDLDSSDPGLDYDDLPTDAPGHDDPDMGPQACQLPCDAPRATHRVTIAGGGMLLLCPRHASIHATRIPLPGICDGIDRVPCGNTATEVIQHARYIRMSDGSTGYAPLCLCTTCAAEWRAEERAAQERSEMLDSVCLGCGAANPGVCFCDDDGTDDDYTEALHIAATGGL